MNKIIFPIAGLVFSFLNILDLILTLTFYQYESNLLVLSNPQLFYPIKMVSIFIILTASLYGLKEWG